METTLVSSDPAPADLVAIDDMPPDLTYLHGFAAEDLAQNREGRLSPNQRHELHEEAQGHVFGVAVLLALLILGFVQLGVRPVSVIWCVICLYYVARLVQRVAEYRRGVVSEVVGDARAQVQHDSEGPDCYWLSIDGLKLELSYTQYLSFRSGGPYRIYYVGDTNTVVGGEVLSGWRPLSAPPKSERRWWQNFSIGVE